MSPHASVYISVHGNVIFTFDQLYPPYILGTYSEKERDIYKQTKFYMMNSANK